MKGAYPQGQRIKVSLGAGNNWYILAGGVFSAAALMHRMATFPKRGLANGSFC